MIATHNSDFVV